MNGSGDKTRELDGPPRCPYARPMRLLPFVAGWLCGGLLLALPLPARADDSAINDGAYGPEPRGATAGEESIIRMESERIEVRFGKETSTVRARFVFRSGKPDVPARQLVGFPDIGAGQCEAERRARAKGESIPEDGNPVSGPMQDLHTLVDGQEVASELQYGYVIEDKAVGWKPGTPKNGSLMAWHTMWVSFPPDKDVVIERRYRVSNGSIVGGIVSFGYVTVTGAAWRGTIGRMDVDVTLDGWTVRDLAWKAEARRSPVFKGLPWCEPDKTQWTVLSPTHLQFSWKDFEPRTDKERRGFSLLTLGQPESMQPEHGK